MAKFLCLLASPVSCLVDRVGGLADSVTITGFGLKFPAYFE